MVASASPGSRRCRRCGSRRAEAVGLWLSVQLARRAAGVPFSRSGQTGLSKVLSALPESRRRGLRRFSKRIFVGTSASANVRASMGETVPTLIETFERCFSEGVALGFDYRDRKGAHSRRRVEPHGVYVELPVWYVLAVDIDKDAARMFRMDRIRNPRPLTRSFTPSEDVLEAFLQELSCGFGEVAPLA